MVDKQKEDGEILPTEFRILFVLLSSELYSQEILVFILKKKALLYRSADEDKDEIAATLQRLPLFGEK